MKHMTDNRILFFTIGLIMFVQLNVLGRSALAQLPTTQESATSPTAVCRVDKAVVYADTTVTLTAITSLGDEGTQTEWSTTFGSLTQNGIKALWSLSNARPGVYIATANVSDAQGPVDECSVRVIVRSLPIEQKGGYRETGRDFLINGEDEAKGFGLYSYVLLGSEPEGESRERYLSGLEAYLRFPGVAALELYIPRNELNITYLPLRAPADDEFLQALIISDYRSASEWLMRNYDYARARAILRRLPGDNRDGPYLVSFSEPVREGLSVSRPYIFQNQSWVPPQLISHWVNEFLNQAAQQDFSNTRGSQQLVLKVRTIIGILAIGLPDVKQSVNEWIAWVE